MQTPSQYYQGSSRDGQIFLKLEQTSFSSGETLSGTVYLNLHNNISGGKLMIKFNGQENAMFTLSETKPIPQTNTHNQPAFHQNSQMHHAQFQETIQTLKRDHSDFISLNLPLYTFDNLSVGKYTFPFSFLIPPNLPNSFFAKGPDYQAEIAYHVSVELFQFFQPNDILQYREKIRISDIKGKIPVPVIEEKFLGLQVCCCCKKKGGVGIVVSLEKNVLIAGEQVGVSVDLDTMHSSSDIKSVTCSLVQTVSLKCQGKSFTTYQSEVICEGGLVKKENAAHLEGRIRVAMCQQGEVDGYMMYGNTEEQKKESISNLKGQTSVKGVFAVPTKGSNVEVSHEILVSCSMKGCCVSSADMRIPVVVQNKEADLSASVPFTANQAHVMESVVLIANAQDVNYAPDSSIYQPEIPSMVERTIGESQQMISQKKEKKYQ